MHRAVRQWLGLNDCASEENACCHHCASYLVFVLAEVSLIGFLLPRVMADHNGFRGWFLAADEEVHALIYRQVWHRSIWECGLMVVTLCINDHVTSWREIWHDWRKCDVTDRGMSYVFRGFSFIFAKDRNELAVYFGTNGAKNVLARWAFWN